jgi:chromosomal replication initiation ATPase DnaA
MTATLQSNLPLLNPDQRSIFDEIMTEFRSTATSKPHFFLHGDGGVGKTFLSNCILNAIRIKPHTVAIAVCSSAKGAELLHLGTTAHSRF